MKRILFSLGLLLALIGNQVYAEKFMRSVVLAKYSGKDAVEIVENGKIVMNEIVDGGDSFYSGARLTVLYNGIPYRCTAAVASFGYVTQCTAIKAMLDEGD